jgi:hypothetical protein
VAAQLTVPARFNGPPASGHGGYTAGAVAVAFGAPFAAAVSLRLPPPLDTPLAVVREADGVTVRSGDTVVALAEPAAIAVDPPAMPEPTPPAPEDPVYGELHEHPFPTCFGCGPERPDGLRIFATRLAGKADMVAAHWTPDPALGNAEVAPEFVWAALDCPTGHACAIEAPAVLARLAVRRLAPVRPGVPHVVAAWQTDRDGRKHHAAGCLYDATTGTPVAVSTALWIELRDPATLGAAGR